MKHTVGKVVEIGAGKEEDVTIYTVPAGKRFKVTKIIVAFPTGQAFALEVYLKYGIQQVVPDEGVLVGDGHSYAFEEEWEYDSGTDIKLHGKNTDTANAQKVFVLLEGELI